MSAPSLWDKLTMSVVFLLMLFVLPLMPLALITLDHHTQAGHRCCFQGC